MAGINQPNQSSSRILNLQINPGVKNLVSGAHRTMYLKIKLNATNSLCNIDMINTNFHQAKYKKIWYLIKNNTVLISMLPSKNSVFFFVCLKKVMISIFPILLNHLKLHVCWRWFYFYTYLCNKCSAFLIFLLAILFFWHQ